MRVTSRKELKQCTINLDPKGRDFKDLEETSSRVGKPKGRLAKEIIQQRLQLQRDGWSIAAKESEKDEILHFIEAILESKTLQAVLRQSLDRDGPMMDLLKEIADNDNNVRVALDVLGFEGYAAKIIDELFECHDQMKLWQALQILNPKEAGHPPGWPFK